jgi:hypothetical protein
MASAIGVSVVAAAPTSVTTAKCTVVTDHCETNIVQASSFNRHIGGEVDSGISGNGRSRQVRDTDNNTIVGAITVMTEERPDISRPPVSGLSRDGRPKSPHADPFGADG